MNRCLCEMVLDLFMKNQKRENFTIEYKELNDIFENVIYHIMNGKRRIIVT